ncbi:UDP-xylose and UDP-N-acetylglucosamine transporter [Diorhabda sublineata]|uniref:UDP-xylose and UDP-N-acetylglucosamine transporter n=1 Tax=Diorhabda sublineata TaxID=1163346 RepID=UPI0024E18F39|nr:UDP-xylose and UDP-N-acetylglucosamine transporter [Diorhabda sublineata]XP_056635721.1 UDP-xylose and UDP-N-acetylglucosamine transporter [Diorhabda sublineata]XP_056635730.1 UDP-xylose and UDP-N-acetylglucosamine transporter [Diorhabda sublineata]
MNAKATQAIIFTLVGCMLNNIFLEYIIKLDPGAGHLITLCQFIFIAMQGLIFTSKFGTVKPKIPFSNYMTLVVLFFTTSVVNNWAFAFNIPVPLHMIFRAGSLIANMILGIIVLKKKYTLEKYLSVILITLGIIICTLYSSKSKEISCTDCNVGTGDVPEKNTSEEEVSTEFFFWWMIGIFLLTGALLLSAAMGIFQERLYQKYDKHPQEALFYTHILPLPGFLLYSVSLSEHIDIANKSDMYTLPLINISLPIIWCLLFLNVVTQYMCISNVYILTSECASLTVTLVITLRKFFSLVFSIIYFQNPFTLAHWIGTIMVFTGTLMFSETHKKILGAFMPPQEKVSKKKN